MRKVKKRYNDVQDTYITSIEDKGRGGASELKENVKRLIYLRHNTS